MSKINQVKIATAKPAMPNRDDYLADYAWRNFHSSNHNRVSFDLMKCKVNSELDKYAPFDYLNGLSIDYNEISQVILPVLSAPFIKSDHYALVFELYERVKNIPFSILFKHLLDFVLKDHINVKSYMSSINTYYVRYLEHLKKNPIVKDYNNR